MLSSAGDYEGLQDSNPSAGYPVLVTPGYQLVQKQRAKTYRGTPRAVSEGCRGPAYVCLGNGLELPRTKPSSHFAADERQK